MEQITFPKRYKVVKELNYELIKRLSKRNLRLRPVDVLLEPGDTKMRRPKRLSTGMLGREQLGVLHERSLVHLLQRRSGPALRVSDQSAHVLLLVPDANVRAASRPGQPVRSVRTLRVRG